MISYHGISLSTRWLYLLLDSTAKFGREQWNTIPSQVPIYAFILVQLNLIPKSSKVGFLPSHVPCASGLRITEIVNIYSLSPSLTLTKG